MCSSALRTSSGLRIGADWQRSAAAAGRDRRALGAAGDHGGDVGHQDPSRGRRRRRKFNGLRGSPAKDYLLHGVGGYARRRLYDHPMPSPRTVLSVVGARPNFMKIAPIVAELRRRRDEFDTVLVHTGQHYDETMSRIFFDELGVREPDHTLDVGSGTHAEQTARVMERLEPVLLDGRPRRRARPRRRELDACAASLAACKLGFPVAHVEAGLRSFDRTMPEEINRLVTDSVSDLLFTHSPEAARPPSTRGHRRADEVHFVGNTMIDTLLAMRRAHRRARRRR